MAAMQTCLVTAYTLISFRILKNGTMALYSLFLMSGGMTVPYIWGLLFLNESFSLLRTAALMIIIIAVLLSNFDRKRIDKSQIFMCVGVFILNGFVSVISKLHQIEKEFVTVNSAEFVLWGGICKLIIAGMIYFAVKNKGDADTSSKTGIGVLSLIAISALISGLSYLLQLYGAINLPATVLYPFVTGGCIISSTIIGDILFKERLNIRLFIGVILCFIGTIMFL